jgi:hypothetical protein
MKISFPKYGTGELLTQKQFAPWIIAFVAIGLVAAVCGSFLLGNKWWLLAIAVLGIAGILFCFGAAVAIFLKQSQVNEVPIAPPIEENVSEPTTHWNYRPRKPTRARAFLDSPSAETSDGLSSDPPEINNNAWLNDHSLGGADPTFIDGPPETEETITEALPQATDPVRSAPTVEDAGVSTYD